jgi:hypothetical protein
MQETSSEKLISAAKDVAITLVEALPPLAITDFAAVIHRRETSCKSLSRPVRVISGTP